MLEDYGDEQLVLVQGHNDDVSYVCAYVCSCVCGELVWVMAQELELELVA